MSLLMLICVAAVFPAAFSQPQMTMRQQEIIRNLTQEYKEAAKSLDNLFNTVKVKVIEHIKEPSKIVEKAKLEKSYEEKPKMRFAEVLADLVAMAIGRRK